MQQIQNTETRVHEVKQAMTERVDKVENQMESICFSQKAGAKKAMGYGVFGLKDEILQELDKEIDVPKTKLMVKFNEDRQTTATRL